MQSPESLLRPLQRLLRPLVRLLMQSGVTFPVLADLLRGLYVDVAVRDVLTDARAQTDSRISLLTGVHRKEIRRLRLAAPTPDATSAVVTLNSQVISRWLGMAPWIDAQGRPLVLPRVAESRGGVSFDELVGSVTKDVRARAVLDDWLSQGIATMDANERVTLNVAAFVPAPGREEQLFYFARNLHDHIAAACANISVRSAPPFMDRSLHFDRLPAEAAQRLQAMSREGGQRLLLELNKAALMLTEGAPPAEGVTQRINVGVYVYIEDEAAGGDG